MEEHRGELGTFWCEDVEILKLEIPCDAVNRMKDGSAGIAWY